MTRPLTAPSAFPRALTEALKHSHLPSLDGLRALAVLIVVLYHSGLPINGGLGVTMFFAISGFLITWLLLQEEARWGAVSLRLFYIRRSLRIFPAFYVFWFLVIVVRTILTGKPVAWPHAITAFFYVGNYYQAITDNWTTPLFHTWSLAIEEQFYLLWPTAFIALKTNQARLRALLIAIPFFWAYRLVLVALGVSQAYIYAALDTRADHLLTGCALALLLFLGKGAAIWKALTSRKWAYLLTLTLLALSSSAMVAYGRIYRDTLGFMLDPLLTIVLLVQGLTLSPACFNWRPVRYVGRISYSVYLYHMLATPPAHKLLAGWPAVVRLSGGVGAAVFMASLSYYLIERPFLKLKDSRGQRRQVSVPTAAAAAAPPGF